MAAKRSPLARGEGRAALMFISPWLIGFVVFTAGPMIASLVLSFTDYEMIKAPHGVGLANYQQLVQDPKIAKSLMNTFISRSSSFRPARWWRWHSR